MRPLIIITGPTAVGKTALSVRLAKAIGGEIISADSMQVYRHMDIGSAKIKKEEMDGVPHYLIDVLDPEEEFNVTVFQKMAKEAVEEIYSHGHIPIVAGGTGFYIQALLYDIDFTENGEDTSIRMELEKLGQERGAEFLHNLLRDIDPDSADEIHENNMKRVIRAIEYYRQTGERISEHNKRERQKKSPYDFLYYVVNTDRARLYERIDRRVDLMLKQGLVEEVMHLKDMGLTRDMVSMQGLGYKEILDYLQGIYTLEEAIYVLKRDTRHFAKRQITWFKRERDVRWLDLPDFNNDLDQMLIKMLQDINEMYELENNKQWK
ncbi:tRNA delta(2)-isopentenylpyrophosphate transferase [Lacrimispora sphenoides]|uniref:tRNA dimethylallyltransferase n=2 Tax=Lacrimispora sphenoides TaxID=29370 RepID=A0ABY1C6N3_9FIRM|nr:tRNA (adenosine(37)-N6)-dimethylallyltransferase MiaA [Lacrimispora sphenoides]SET74799.1 tRNA dimethylallyltransferase [[Clostridium] sphenoides JCM 1415]SUY50959.1 tRNA delta(2)-isopentenylpyrophosphate transferase [Lacrimispora sphenoides]